MKTIFIIIIFIFIAAVLGYFLLTKTAMAPITGPTLENKTADIQVKSMDFSQISPEFLFLAEIPKKLEVEHTPQLKAINIYNPELAGEKNIDKSQIYITYFKADGFLTLNTVEITQQDKMIINGHDAILYEITKKSEAPNFSGQPNWRNFKHKAIDIRLKITNPSYFYSFAHDPTLSEKIFNDFINSLVFL